MLSKSDITQIAGLLKPIKDDISGLKKDMKDVKGDIKVVKAHNFRIDFNVLEIKEKFDHDLKVWKSELFTKIDFLMGRAKTAEEENTILVSSHPRKAKLLKRVEKIEIHLGLPSPSAS